jgi:hypothetical protein
MDTHIGEYGRYTVSYSEDDQMLMVFDLQNHREVIRQKLDAETYHNYPDDTLKSVFYRRIDFDQHEDFVLLSGWNAYTVYLYRHGRFVRSDKLGALFGCCTTFERDSTKKQLITTHVSSNSAAWRSWVYKEKLFFQVSAKDIRLVKREMYDNDICSLQRKTTTHYDKTEPYTTVEYLADKDHANELFLEAALDDGRMLRLCRSAALPHGYGHVIFDPEGRLLTPYGDIAKTLLYADQNQTVARCSDANETLHLFEDRDKHLHMLLFGAEGVEKRVRKILTIKSGTLQDAFKKPNAYHQRTVLNPHKIAMSLFNKARNQKVYIGDMAGLMVVEDMTEQTNRSYRVEIPGGGFFVLNVFWGKARNILYVDNAEELVEINLKTSQRRTVFAYNDIAPEVRMRFSQQGRKALLWIEEDEKATIHLVDLKTLQTEKIASEERGVLEGFAFDAHEKQLLLTYKSGEKKRTRLPR